MNINAYIPDLLSTMQEPRKGHLAELERRAMQSFGDLAKLEKLPKIDALRERLYEKQFNERLMIPQGRPGRLHMINEQRKLRANFASAVLTAHEIHYDVKLTWDFMAILLPGSDEDYQFHRYPRSAASIFMDPVISNSAALALLHQQYCPDPRATADLLDTVPDAEPGTIQSALRSLFDEVLLEEAEISFSEPLELTFINLHSTSKETLVNFEKAFTRASETWRRYELARAEYISAKAGLNEPQYAARLEQAIRSGNADKERQVEAEHNRSRVQLYCATMACNHFFDQLAPARAELRNQLVKVAGGINDADLDQFTDKTLNDLLRDKVRNNCICARLLISKMDKPGPRPDLSRLDDKIFFAVRAALNSFNPLLSVYRESMLASLG